MLSISPGDGTSVTISGPTGIGSIRLWAPETICTDIGCAAVYPPGTPRICVSRSVTWRRERRPRPQAGSRSNGGAQERSSRSSCGAENVAACRHNTSRLASGP